MQLLRLGLVNYTTIGKTFQKENKDNYIIAALIVDGIECLCSLISTLASLKISYDAKNNRFKSKQKEGAFFIQIVGEKEIVVVRSKKEQSKLNIPVLHSKFSYFNKNNEEKVPIQMNIS